MRIGFQSKILVSWHVFRLSRMSRKIISFQSFEDLSLNIVVKLLRIVERRPFPILHSAGSLTGRKFKPPRLSISIGSCQISRFLFVAVAMYNLHRNFNHVFKHVVFFYESGPSFSSQFEKLMTRFQLILPADSQNVTNNRTVHRMHIEGPKIC